MNLKFDRVLLLLSLLATPAFSQEQVTTQGDLYELSLEELMNVPINSASKKDETLFDAPLSSYTITKADLEIWRYFHYGSAQTCAWCYCS